jgi:hypothetical protein
VVAVRTAELLQWAGDVALPDDRPVRLLVTFKLGAEGAGTHVALRVTTLMGGLEDTARSAIDHRWKLIMEQGLKPYLDSGLVAARPAAVRAEP